MKEREYIDLGRIFDDIFEATQKFGDAFKESFACNEDEEFFHWNEHMDFYPLYSYPPANVYLTEDKELVFEFAMAGFAKDNIDLKFHGDYMILNAAIEENETDKKIRYFKKRLKKKPIKDQKYFVPADKFDHDKVNAVYKRGILTVELPSKETAQKGEGVKVDIKEEEE